MPKPIRPLADKFWERVTKSQNGCWPFNNAKTESNYGYVVHDGKNIVASRVSWELHFGPIPDGLFVLHECDNPPCVNPDHLFLGTQADNVADMISKGRQSSPEQRSNPGEENGMAKVTDGQRDEMVRLRSLGWLRKDLAIKYGLTDGQVGRLCRAAGVFGGMPKTWTTAQRTAITQARNENPQCMARDVVGEKNPRAIVTEPQVLCILQWPYSYDGELQELANEFDIGMGIIQHIRSGKNWKHLHHLHSKFGRNEDAILIAEVCRRRHIAAEPAVAPAPRAVMFGGVQ